MLRRKRKIWDFDENKIERTYNNIEAGTETFRGFRWNIRFTNLIMKGLKIYYTFIGKYEALKNKTTSEPATDLEFKSSNWWLELMELSSMF